MERRNVKNVRIIRNLLERPGGEWTKYALAKSSGCSRQWVIQLLRKMESRKLVEGTRVLDIMATAEYGAGLIPKHRKVITVYHPEPIRFLESTGEAYAVTTYFAENLITHILFPTRCDAYVKMDSMKPMVEKIKKEGLIGGGNMRLIVPVDDIVVEEINEVNGLKLVGLGQLMIDLAKEGGVCIQALEEMVNRNVSKE